MAPTATNRLPSHADQKRMSDDFRPAKSRAWGTASGGLCARTCEVNAQQTDDLRMVETAGDDPEHRRLLVLALFRD
jgi:hypothetical protein